MPRVDRTVGLLCLIIFVNTFSIGAFPVLLPEIGRSNGIEYFALGAIAGAFGLARVFADIPAGLFITHHLRRALVLGVLCVAAGVICLGLDGPYGLLLTGRALGGMGHALTMLGGMTAIIRYAPSRSRAFSLNAFEMCAMLGVLCGMITAGFLPAGWPWNTTLLAASAPQALALMLLPAVLWAIPSDAVAGTPRALFSRGLAAELAADSRRRIPRTTILAFTVGCVIAVAWSSIGQFILPIRASRDFELGRKGVAMLLSIPQIFDVLLLLPIGLLADRTSHARVLAVVLVIMAAGVAAIAFGSMHVVILGSMLGIGLAGWMLPVSLLNQDGTSRAVSWRTALYRTGVDAGVFLGPVLSGLLTQHDMLWMLTASTSVALGILGWMLFRLPLRR